jgi:hypothetical protein
MVCPVLWICSVTTWLSTDASVSLQHGSWCLQGDRSKGECQEETRYFYDLASEVACHHVHLTLVITQVSPPHMGGGDSRQLLDPPPPDQHWLRAAHQDTNCLATTSVCHFSLSLVQSLFCEAFPVGNSSHGGSMFLNTTHREDALCCLGATGSPSHNVHSPGRALWVSHCVPDDMSRFLCHPTTLAFFLFSDTVSSFSLEART